MRLFRTKRGSVFTAETRRRGEKRGEYDAFALRLPPRLRVSAVKCLLLSAVAVGAIAQTASEKPPLDVRRVGARLACKCGCKDSVASCSMLECEYSKPAKLRIAQMQSTGYTDQQIVQAFIRDYGQGIYLAEPDAWGWIVPYVSAGVGLIFVWLFIRKYRKPKPIAEIGPMELDDPNLVKYKEQIEKDLANLE